MHQQTLPQSRALFTVAGRITGVDPAARRLRILNQDVVLAPTPPFVNLEPGLVLDDKGYQDPTSGQRIATRLLHA
jgi:hypothetical protein